ncbi:hypothetical protein C8R44DRAFT_893496 [Mycena epipterygia]|nr:hypothetical protein C8R44DRAFT_893496 [Mycena epipterygia]
MSYNNRGPRAPTYSTYDSDSDSDEYVPPPPPPPAATGRRYNYGSDSDESFSPPSYPTRQPQPPPPPPPLSLQPGRGYASPGPPPPPKPNYPPAGGSAYRASPPPSTYPASPPTTAYQSPPPTTYRESPPPTNYRGSTPPSNYHQSPPGNYRGSTPPNNYQSPSPPAPYRGGAPPSGAYRPSPPPSARGTPPPSAYGSPQRPYAPSSLNRTESYSEDYSAYGISNTTPRPQTGRYMTEDMSARVGEKNAQDFQTPPAFDRRKTEQMALTIGGNLKRDEASIAAKIGDLVSSSSEKLTAAQNIVDKVIENDTYKLAKDQVEAIMSPAKDVIAMLEILIKLEVDRRDNDKSIAVLHLAMTNLLFILSYLEPTFDTADKIKTMLQKFLEEVCKTMNQFGNFCDAYYKQRGMVRMIRSSGYKKKLAGFATSFDEHKKELQYLMTTKTAATVTKMDTNVQDVSAKLDQVLAFINLQNPKERAIAKRIQEYPGGENAAVLDDKLLAKIGKIVGEEISSQTKFALRENIDDVLKSNFARFGLKVETAMNEIKDAVARSTETIMTRLDAGPHDLIDDEDIKAVWKDMVLILSRKNWRLSCKCRHFVDAVHHHFAQKFGKFTLETGEPHPERWTLKFMSNIIFYPAIGDAIDEDGSGYISVHECNRFFNSRPKGWTATQWMAYWATGWYVNAVSYRHRCMALITSIEDASAKVLPQNKSLLKPYLKKDCYGKIRLMIEGLYTDNLQYHGEATGTEYENLDKFRRELMDDELSKMKSHLAKPRYSLDSKEAVVAVLGTHRVEVSVLCLLYLVLRRHKKIIDFASTLVLEEMEFETMVESIENISEAFETRFHNLLESWRQLRLDTKLQACSTLIVIGCFAGGIFEAWHEEFYDNQSDSDSDWDSELDSSDDEEFKAEERAAHAEDASDPKKARDILLYGIPPQPSKSETQRLKKELEAKKAKKEAKKKAKKAASAALTDSDSDVETGYDKTKDKERPYSYDSDEESEDGASPTKGGYDSDRPKSSAKKSLYEYDSEFDYENSDLWNSDEESDSGSSSDSSASDFVTRKVKKPKVEERLTDMENQLFEMQATLKQILSLTKKNLSNR